MAQQVLHERRKREADPTLSLLRRTIWQHIKYENTPSGNKHITMKTEPVTTLKSQATQILAELHASKEPVLITEHGQPAAYLVGVEGYEHMLKRMQILEGIAKGEQAIREDKVTSHTDVKEKMSKWLK